MFPAFPNRYVLIGLVLLFFSLHLYSQTYINKEWVQNHGALDTEDWSVSTLAGVELITAGNSVVAGQHANILVTKFDGVDHFCNPKPQTHDYPEP